MSRKSHILSKQKIQEILNESADDCSEEDSDHFDEGDEVENYEVETDASETSIDSDASIESLSKETREIIERDNNILYAAKNHSVQWHKQPQVAQNSKMRKECVLLIRPGPSQLARSMVSDIKASFHIFITTDIKTIIVEMTNLKGLQLYDTDWERMDTLELEAYIGLLLMAGPSAKLVVQNIQDAVEIISAAPSKFSKVPDNPSALGKIQRCFFWPHTKNSAKHSTVCDECKKFICKKHSVKAIICQNCQK